MAGKMPRKVVCMVSIFRCVLMVNLLAGRQTEQAAGLVYEIVVIWEIGLKAGRWAARVVASA